MKMHQLSPRKSARCNSSMVLRDLKESRASCFCWQNISPKNFCRINKFGLKRPLIRLKKKFHENSIKSRQNLTSDWANKNIADENWGGQICCHLKRVPLISYCHFAGAEERGMSPSEWY